MWQNICYAFRLLRRDPTFTAVVIISLALGIGANTVVFSIVHAVLLRALPYPDPDQLLRVAQQVSHDDISIPEYEFLKANSSTFSVVAAHRDQTDQNMTVGASSEWIKAMPVTANFFRALGVDLLRGREFGSKEGIPDSQDIIISDALRQRAFSGVPDVLGRIVQLNGKGYIVSGVLPRGFWFPQASDAFVQLQTLGASDSGNNTKVIARLKPGVTRRQAEAELATISNNYRRANSEQVPSRYQGLTAISYQEWLVGDVRMNLLLMFGAVGILLVIACSNLVSLLMARVATRQKEIALRLALGAKLGQLLRQFIIENTILGLTGSLIGLLVASWLMDGLLAIIPFSLPSSVPIRLDTPVLLFTIALGLGTSIAFSLAPFIMCSRININETLKSGGRCSGSGHARQSTWNVLIVGEVALSFTLLVSAALLIQSVYRMHQEQLGFTSRGLITLWTPPPLRHYRNGSELWEFEKRLMNQIGRLPGVRQVAAVSVLPLTDQNNFPVERYGHPEQSLGGMEIRVVTPNFFETMGIRLIRGRSINFHDLASSKPVILVNETLARRWWPQGDSLGDRLLVGRFHGRELAEMNETPREVVGVVGDTKTVYLKEPPRPTVYLPAAQTHWYTHGMAWAIRASGTTPEFGGLLRKAVAEVNPGQRVERLRTMDEIVATTSADSRFDAWLLGSFAGIALILTAIGVYGLLSFSVARRTSEIGVRLALGASRAALLVMVLKQGMRVTTIGFVLGLAAAFVVTRFLSKLLYGIRSNDLFSFGIALVILYLVSMLASYLPARRATTVDPMVALRIE